MTEDDQETLRARVEQLRLEHRDSSLNFRAPCTLRSQILLQIQRLKKRKLVVKDLIARLESGIIPDIIA